MRLIRRGERTDEAEEENRYQGGEGGADEAGEGGGNE